MKFTSLFVAAAAASNIPHFETDAFADNNWPTLYKAWLNTEMNTSPVGKGTVSWSQCADDAGVWTFDTAGSTYSPNPVSRGKTLTVSIKGPLSAPIHVDNFNIEVYLGSTKVDSLQQAGGDWSGEFELTLSQKLPYLSPPGHYTIKAVANGSKSNGTVLCANAELDL